jgi:hypothetical protein
MGRIVRHVSQTQARPVLREGLLRLLGRDKDKPRDLAKSVPVEQNEIPRDSDAGY